MIRSFALAAVLMAFATGGAAAASAPQTTISGKPVPGSLDRTATFTFTASLAGSTFECKLDSGAWAACTSPRSLTALATGAHKFQVRAVKGTAKDSSPASYSWTIAKEYPVDWTILGTMKSLSIKKGDSVTWTWSGTGRHDVDVRKGSSRTKGTIVAESDPLRDPGTFTRKFTAAGSFIAYCTLHSNMSQKITVK